MFSLPRVTQAIIIANVLAFLAEQALGGPFIVPLALWPLGPEFMPWQVVTYSFLHANFTHLLFNMLGVWMFGADIERVWGTQRFAIYYLVCVVSAAAMQLVVTALMQSDAPTLGASGGVFGILLAFGLMFPNRIVVPLIPPIPMPARVFVFVYGALELVLGVTGTQEGVAHFAHLGGMLGGWILIRLWRRPGGFTRRR